MKWLAMWVIVSLSWCAAFASLASGDGRSSTVGVSAAISDVVLPGPELEAAPPNPNAPIVLRLLATRPHGTEFRYDLEWTALEAGRFDLAPYLRPKNGAAAVSLPSIEVQARSLLAPERVTPNAPRRGAIPSFGGYRTAWIVGGAVWVAGLVWILSSGRKRRLEAEAAARPKTLAERLRPLVERARANQLSRVERAQLELGLVAYWRRKLRLEDRRPDEALTLLREHAEAGPLLTSLERWLHLPPSARSADEVDVNALLEPYRDLPPEALELGTQR